MRSIVTKLPSTQNWDLIFKRKAISQETYLLGQSASSLICPGFLHAKHLGSVTSDTNLKDNDLLVWPDVLSDIRFFTPKWQRRSDTDT